MTSYTFNEKSLRTLLKQDTKALGITSGAANIFIDEALKSAHATIHKRKIITEADLTRIIAKELKKYHQDLAYVYQNRDKII